MKKKIIITLVSIVLVGAVIVAVSNKPSPANQEKEPIAQEQLSAEDYTAALAQQAAVDSSKTASVYTHPKFGFSFQKPEGYTVGSLQEGEGEVLVVQPANVGAKEGFQIFITELYEPLTLTPDVIKKELPGTTVVGSQKIKLDGADGIMFSSNATSFDGRSFEIWFVHDEVLYQVTSYSAFSQRLQDIIGTWRFN